ncbi:MULTISPECIES: response regulator transcription factor [Brevibacillus]|jgi:Response regulators consisting of a CheY-like receiver domain and a winged-helix DNA-binding domain|uniref:DNA-binding response regulator n=1 Tax=Brevibacillus parabrevis TaxID=54914 RepID=A0A4Y3PJA3_BREPA|nr:MULTISPECIES: response regulator transcription factor [Brevibacillus]MDH6352821.1 DNA-binding response OmpR family regulator [Brevibacillus sp. 1238]MED2255080.1 response regulator transcription factor [Brevibacillus parabrevis]RNB93079.1 DNA-binding response regulator [Brevibacillus parabrevis]UED69877.1 response regulator transcription factor [Brevibacillus sp. HD3.3A]WDV96178.1 response regulator transcription factor [Brevibacillus parabrevis]
MTTRILIIEDETTIAQLERDYFELNGFQVDLCHTGNEGLQLALHDDYSLIIVDLQLPGMDGFELCSRIRQAKEVPILIVSAKKEEIDKIRAFNLGADDYITKPFSPSELVARAKAHLTRYERLTSHKEPAAKSEIHIRGLVIDKASRRVFVRNEEVIFTTREFNLLEFLTTHPNRVFSKNELFERIWGMDSSGDIATVTVHIRKLREKIEVDPSNPQYIETVWGAGYRFTV